MLNIILYQPEIPPNTGNVIRLCANAGAQLHLIHPLGFALDDKKLRRAGLDYHEFAQVQEHTSLDEAIKNHSRVFAITTHGSTPYYEPEFNSNDTFIFGAETRGLPAEFLNSLPEKQKLRIPMQKESRSLNLSNSVAIILYEALRQLQPPNLS